MGKFLDLEKMKVNSISENKSAIKQVCEQFINSTEEPHYIFGTNDFAKSVAKLIDVEGFIDEFTENDTFLNKPIIKTISTLPENSIVLSCNVIGRPITVSNKLNKHSIKNINYYDFLKYSDLPIKQIEYWEGFKDSYYKNLKDYNDIYNQLFDTKSKEIFEKIIKFRLTCDLSFMEGFEDTQYKQYFEDFLNLKEQGEVFVDIGGFDGYTSKEFIKLCPNFKKVYFFEPDSKNIKIAKNKLIEYTDIEYFELGVSNKKETLRFEDEAGSASKITDTGSIVIEVDTIDNLKLENVSYIKMDIEGSESVAIEGAKQTILKYHPRLAICVYHKGEDLIEIPKQILAIRNDYNLYLRHYTEGFAETVMFFIPKTQ